MLLTHSLLKQNSGDLVTFVVAELLKTFQTKAQTCFHGTNFARIQLCTLYHGQTFDYFGTASYNVLCFALFEVQC